MVGEKGLEPSPLARPVPKTGVSAIPPLAQQIQMVLYMIETICPTTIIANYIIFTL
tara:strand:- start:226 stop:393 length:168 start_codon:yes stop_codon:yes gene_type:complete